MQRSKKNNILFKAYQKNIISINSIHHQVIDKLWDNLEVIWVSHDHYIEAIQHKSKNIIWIQWHPESIDSWKIFEKCFWNQTNEEKLYCDFANNYADFINTIPWYEYDFGSELKKLWQTQSNSGLKRIRSFERKASIGLELWVKALLGKVIKKMTQPHSEAPKLETQVELEIDDIEVLQNLEWVNIIEDIDTWKYRVSLPKYKLIRILDAMQNVWYTFQNIAGNTDIMICINGNPDQDLHQIYSQNSTLSFDSKEWASHRRFVYVPVNELKNFYEQVADANLEIEHIFDY